MSEWTELNWASWTWNRKWQFIFQYSWLVNSMDRGARQTTVYRVARRPGFDPWVGKDLWRTKWKSTPVLLPGKSHGWKSVVGYKSMGSQRVGHDWATSLGLEHALALLKLHKIIEYMYFLWHFIWFSIFEVYLYHCISNFLFSICLAVVLIVFYCVDIHNIYPFSSSWTRFGLFQF